MRNACRFVITLLIVLNFGGKAQAAQTVAYVASFTAGSVTVVDLSTNAVIATIPVGSQPQGSAIRPDGKFVYVANSGATTVSVIDTDTQSVSDTITVGSSPLGVAVTPNGAEVWVANTGSNNISVISTATHQVVATIPSSGTAPEGVAFRPDGAFAYVTNNTTGNVSVVNTSTRAVVTTVPTGANALGVAVRPDGAFAYVCNANSGVNTVSVINTATNAVVANIPVGSIPYAVAFRPDGAFAYVSNINSSNVSVINTATNTVVATIPTAATPIGIAVRPDGQFAYVATGGNNSLTVINTSSNTVSATVPVAAGPNSLGMFIGSITGAPAGTGTNVSQGKPPVVNPFNQIGISVSSSSGGIIQLLNDVTVLSRAAVRVSTNFDDIPGRATNDVPGLRPSHRFTAPGVFVATVNAFDAATNVLKGKGRKMLAISAREIGAASAPPVPADTTVSVKSLKGKFQFVKTTADSVSFSGEITLPPGFDVTNPAQTLALGIGNITDSIVVDARGKATLPGASSRVTKAKIKFPKLPKGSTVTTGGEKAQIQLTIASPGLSTAGFDTEGIAVSATPATEPQQRSIQIALVLGGVAYETQAPVEFKLSKKSDSGQITSRTSK